MIRQIRINSSRILAECTMVATNGMIVVKILRTTKKMGEPNPMTIITGMELITTIDHVKKIDVLKEPNGNPPEKGTVIEAIAGLETTVTPIVRMNTIASIVAQIKIQRPKRKYPAQKY